MMNLRLMKLVKFDRRYHILVQQYLQEFAIANIRLDAAINEYITRCVSQVSGKEGF